MVGIPAYNEENTIVDVVTESRAFADEVLVVDDGSADATADQVAGTDAILVEHEVNRGYGAALQTIFDEAHERGVDHLVIIDADGQHDPTEIQKLIETQRSTEAQIVIGSRFASGGETDAPLYRRLGLSVINRLTNLGLRFTHRVPRITDTQSGFRVYDGEAIELLSRNATLSEGMDASLDILFQAADAGYEITEIPINITYDVEDASTHHPIAQGATLLFNVLRRMYHDRPARLLSLPGAALLLIGGGLAAAMLSGTIARLVPLTVVAFLISAGGMLSGAAFVLGGHHGR